MERFDVIIAGAGPAGSTCARALSKAGRHTLVLEKENFPRRKPCAGWVTPETFDLLEIDPAEYGRDGRILAPLERFVVWDGRSAEHEISYGRTVSYGVVRAEFDQFLAERCGADVRYGTKVTAFRREGSGWIVNERFEAPVLVGAGGHFCPVARAVGIRSRPEPAVGCMEAEVPLSPEDLDRHVRYPDTPEIIFCDDLNGYGWYFNKGRVLNVGLGRLGGKGVKKHLTSLLEQLRAKGRLPGGDAFSMARFTGHAYKLHGIGPRQRAHEAALLIGDSAGVAYNISGEGIRPAVLSGRLAAQTLVEAKGNFEKRVMERYEHRLDAVLGAPLSDSRLALWKSIPSGAVRSAARGMLRSDFFVRKVVLDRAFLRPGAGLR